MKSSRDEEASSSPRRFGAITLRLLLTAILVVVLLRAVELPEVGTLLADSALGWLPLILLLRPSIYLVRGLRVWQLLSLVEGRLPALRVLGWHFISINIGVFTPAGLGDFSLTHFLRPYGVAVRRSALILLIDKTITFLQIMLLAAIGAAFYLELHVDPLMGGILAGGGGLSIAGLFAARRRVAALRFFREGRGARLRQALRGVAELISTNPRACILNILGAFVQSALYAGQLWLALRMVGAEVGYIPVFWLSNVCRCINLIPMTINGLGVFEGAVVVLMGRIGVGPEVSLAAAIVPRTITWILAALVAGWLLWRRTRSNAA